MSEEHTPSPWKIIEWQGFPIIRSTVNHDNVASIRGNASDAKLICAAPELLQAVQYQLDLMQWIETADTESPFYEETMRLRLNTGRDYMESAIAKATGKDDQ